MKLSTPTTTRTRTAAGRPRWVLGIAGSHNGAAALYRDDALVCAVQEERLSREKRAVLHPGRPSLAVDAVLRDQGLAPDDVDLVVAAPLTGPGPDGGADDVRAHPTLGARPSEVVSHHYAHALSAYACSGFADATALVLDGMGSFARDLATAERAAVLGHHCDGERETASIYAVDRGEVVAREKHLGRTTWRDGDTPTRMGPFASLGMAYQQVAQLTFGSWDAAGKVMGLAPYGRPRFARDAFFDVRADGRLDFHDGADDGIARSVAHARRYDAAGQPPRGLRRPDDGALHEDLAASVQAALEEGVMHFVRRARAATASRRLVCAGGVFLNSVANELVVRSGLFDEVFFVPFAEDSGTAVGAAFHGVVRLLGPRAGTRLVADALGPRVTDRDDAIALALGQGARLADGASGSLAALAARLAAGQAIGFVAGRSELGPRALGQRSILFDPRRADAPLALNLMKGREPFRPFAPAVLRAHAADWFDLGADGDSPFMLRVAAVRPERRDQVPAVTHVDGSARVQTVDDRLGHLSPLADLIRAFAALTGVPLVLNTSFNRAGEPIVETASDAVRSALAMGLGALWLDGVCLELPLTPPRGPTS